MKLSTQEILAGLTEPQREAAEWVDGPLLVLAGAGSGKTRTITRRIAYLVAVGIPAWNILAITFTNKAAGEMRERVNHLLGGEGSRLARGVTVATFHALCARILRDYAVEANLPASFSILDSADQSKLVKQAIKDCGISPDNFEPREVLGTISKAKNKLILPAAYLANAGGFFEKNVARVYAKYEALLAASKGVDFDDLLLKTAILLRDNAAVRKDLETKYQYIMIDEYQDTNHAQFVIAHMLAQNHKNICATGDPDQSIYGWRGANLSNILEFEQFYPNAKVVLLEQNYRSTKVILRAASGLIAHNSKRKKKDLWTENEEGPKIVVVRAGDEHQEAAEIVRRLSQAHDPKGGGLSWDKFAIFYRVNSLSRVLEDALMKAGVPYQIARGTEFYARKEIKDVLAYLKVVANPGDNVALERIINVPPRGLGDTSLARVQSFAAEAGLSLLEACGAADTITGLAPRASAACKKLAELFGQWRQVIDQAAPTPSMDADESAADLFANSEAADEVDLEAPFVPNNEEEGDAAEGAGVAYPPLDGASGAEAMAGSDEVDAGRSQTRESASTSDTGAVLVNAATPTPPFVLLDVIRVPRTRSVQCQCPRCGRRIWQAIHMVQLSSGEYQCWGQDCYAREAAEARLSNMNPRYSGYAGRELTDEEREWLDNNRERLIAEFKAQHEAKVQKERESCEAEANVAGPQADTDRHGQVEATGNEVLGIGRAEEAMAGGVRGLLERVYKESGLEAAFKKKEDDPDNEQAANVEELITVAAEFDAQNPSGTLVDYLAQVSLASDVDKLKDSGGAVTLMTLHAAKGLEFPWVAIAGCEDGLIPHARAISGFGSPDEMEEERRLAFVGITRAMKHLLMTHAQYRMVRGETVRTVASQFFNEIPPEVLDELDLTGDGGAGSLGYRDEEDRAPRGWRDSAPAENRRSHEAAAQRSEAKELAGEFRKGMLVRHPQFGVGRIESIAPAGTMTRASVRFGGAAPKTLILQYARLERVDG